MNLWDKRTKPGPGEKPSGGSPSVLQQLQPAPLATRTKHHLAPPLSGRIRAASSGRRHRAVPAEALPPPAPPAVPAAPKPRESAATAQVPTAVLALQVGATPRPGRTELPREPGFRCLHLPSLLPPALGKWPLPAQLGRDLGSRRGSGRQRRAGSRDRPLWLPSGASSARLPVQCLPSGRRQLRGALLLGAQSSFDSRPRLCAPAHPAARTQCGVSGAPRSSRAPEARVLRDDGDGGRDGQGCVPRLRAQPARYAVLGVWRQEELTPGGARDTGAWSGGGVRGLFFSLILKVPRYLGLRSRSAVLQVLGRIL